MGLSIGTSASALASIAPAPLPRPDRVGEPRDRLLEEPGRVLPREEAPELRAGFGENTLSLPGAALRTLDASRENSRELVETLRELRERARAIEADRPGASERAAEDERTGELRQRESVRPDPDPAVRNFVAEAEVLPREVAGPLTGRPEARPAAPDTEIPRGTEIPRQPAATDRPLPVGAQLDLLV